MCSHVRVRVSRASCAQTTELVHAYACATTATSHSRRKARNSKLESQTPDSWLVSTSKSSRVRIRSSRWTFGGTGCTPEPCPAGQALHRHRRERAAAHRLERRREEARGAWPPDREKQTQSALGDSEPWSFKARVPRPGCVAYADLEMPF